MRTNSRSEIKNRILQRAARSWGYNDQELETSFDPIVSLLLDACSHELEKLNDELNHSNNRIVKKLLDLMLPDIDSSVAVSHGILHVQPVENNTVVSRKHQFFCRKTTPNIYDPTNPLEKDVYFSAPTEVTLSNLSLTHLAFENKIYAIDRILHKQTLCTLSKKLNSQNLWLGFSMPESQSIECLNLYFNTRYTHQKKILLHSLRQAKFYIGDQEVFFEEGLGKHDLFDKVKNRTLSKFSEIEKIEDEIIQYYQQYFIHSPNVPITAAAVKLPESIQEQISEEQKSNLLSEPTCWLRVEFPEVTPTEIYEGLIIGTNCFPILNKKLHKISQKVKPFTNFILLETNDDIFIGIESIEDSNSVKYHLRDFTNDNLEKGNTILRKAGVSRFNERNASEEIQYLIELLKDESTSFSVLGGDFLNDTLRKLNQLIHTLEQQSAEKQFEKTYCPYLIIQPNDMRPETKLQLDKGADFLENNSFLVTSTVGGQSKLSEIEKMAHLKSTILSKGRMVTFADIKAFAKDHFKQSISHLHIQRGFRKNESLYDGLERTIDIHVTRSNEITISQAEWDYMKDSFLFNLEKNSPNLYPYRIEEEIKEL